MGRRWGRRCGRRDGPGRLFPLLVLAVCLGAPTPSPGQEPAADEARLLREASREEEAGDLAAAESRLREVLSTRPESLPSLLALERVLRTTGRLPELVPVIEAALAEEATTPVRRMELRALSDLDREEELAASASEWIAEEPALEVPYREVAAVWRERGEYARARQVLQEGRRQVGGEDALALELGDVYAELGELGMAVEEWARVIDDGGGGVARIRGRVRSLRRGGALALTLVDRVAREPVSTGRLEAAVGLGLVAGLEDRTWALAERLMPRLATPRRRALLDDVARRADAAGMERLAYRAYGALLEIEASSEWQRLGRRSGGDRAESTARARALGDRRAELARRLGEPAGTEGDFAALADSADASPAARRAAEAHRIELAAPRDPDAARTSLKAFVDAHPESPLIDRLSAAVAGALAEEGRGDEAELVLAGVTGPRSAWVRAGLLLERGEPALARLELLRAAVGLKGGDATRALSLARLLAELSPDGGRLVVGVLRRKDQGEPEVGVERGLEGVEGLKRPDRAPILEFLADQAAAEGLAGRAMEIRHRIVAEHPSSNEAPRALLALGRALADDPERRGEAREVLERLVLGYPRSALVPQARSELDRLRREGEVQR